MHGSWGQYIVPQAIKVSFAVCDTLVMLCDIINKTDWYIEEIDVKSEG